MFAATVTTAILAGGIAGPAAAEGPRESVVGAGTVSDRQHVAVAAFGGPTTLARLSDPVTGHFLARGDFGLPDTEFRQEGPVTCLNVQGNLARLVYPNKEANPEFNEAFDVVISILDNGRPQGGESVDKIGFAVVADETAGEDGPSEQDVGCFALVPPPTSTLTQGDFTVRNVVEP